MAQMQQGLAAWRATGAEVLRPYGLALLAKAYAKVGQREDGPALLAEALAVAQDTGERRWEAELYRLKGELLRARSEEHDAEAETCFRRPSPSPATSRPNPGSCARPRAWPHCGSSRASVRKPTTCSRRCMAGSPRGLTPPTSKTPGRCWKSWRDHATETQRPRPYHGKVLRQIKVLVCFW